MKEDHCVDYLSYEWDFDDLMETYKKSCCKSEYSRVEQMRFKNALWRSMSIKSKKDLIDPSTIHWYVLFCSLFFFLSILITMMYH